ncbi:MAG: HAMP domain-containing histidine kinase [Deltaproteobacteria bacterium]|nr:HAMP domain-containing histidine kinase [Deltaproteobacteria bacterium]
MKIPASTDRKRYQALEENFVSSFLDELIPGILHNFANPLNGIMGRSRLLQRRLEDTVKKIHLKHQDLSSEMAEDLNKLLKDIDSIALESDRFFDMFRHAAIKFDALRDHDISSIDLSQLLDIEMKFADFYLDFKHEISKVLVLEAALPEVKGILSDYSMALWSVIRYALKSMRNDAVKEFHASTTYDDTHVYLRFRHSGYGMTAKQAGLFADCLQGGSGDVSPDLDEQRHLLNAMLLLKKYGASTQLILEDRETTLSIGIPYRGHGDVSSAS